VTARGLPRRCVPDRTSGTIRDGLESQAGVTSRSDSSTRERFGWCRDRGMDGRSTSRFAPPLGRRPCVCDVHQLSTSHLYTTHDEVIKMTFNTRITKCKCTDSYSSVSSSPQRPPGQYSLSTTHRRTVGIRHEEEIWAPRSQKSTF
jgi:hypothetical protein